MRVYNLYRMSINNLNPELCIRNVFYICVGAAALLEPVESEDLGPLLGGRPRQRPIVRH